MLVEKAYGQYTDFRIPGMVATEKGSLIRYCECRRTRSDWADIDIKISRSEDMGKTWETVLVIDSEGNTLNNPVMFVYGEKLIFLYCKNYKEIYKTESLDDGKSYSAPLRVDFEGNVDFPYTVVALGPGHGIYHNGRLIVPAWFAYDKEDPKAHKPSFTTTFYSDDGGVSWKVGEPVFKDVIVNGNESAIAVTSDGEYLISIRNAGEKRRRALAKSRDGISGWYGLSFEDNLPDPACMAGMTHKDGRIYHINCATDRLDTPGIWGTSRADLTIKISDDCFKTYTSIPVSELGGYSDIALLGDKICVLYEKTLPNYGPFELFFETL